MDPRVEPSDPTEVWEEGDPAPPQPVAVRVGDQRYIWSVVATALGVLALLAAVRAWPPTAGEPLLLRWLRTCADHPVRATIAALLLLRGLRPSRRAT